MVALSSLSLALIRASIESVRSFFWRSSSAMRCWISAICLSLASSWEADSFLSSAMSLPSVDWRATPFSAVSASSLPKTRTRKKTAKATPRMVARLTTMGMRTPFFFALTTKVEGSALIRLFRVSSLRRADISALSLASMPEAFMPEPQSPSAPGVGTRPSESRTWLALLRRP